MYFIVSTLLASTRSIHAVGRVDFVRVYVEDSVCV